jgi:hypothetical protein
MVLDIIHQVQIEVSEDRSPVVVTQTQINPYYRKWMISLDYNVMSSKKRYHRQSKRNQVEEFIKV